MYMSHIYNPYVYICMYMLHMYNRMYAYMLCRNNPYVCVCNVCKCRCFDISNMPEVNRQRMAPIILIIVSHWKFMYIMHI